MDLGHFHEASFLEKSKPCDPRLSRAARELVRQHLEAILKPTNDTSLIYLLHIAGLRDEHCPLKADEYDLAVVAPAPSTRSQFSLPFAKTYGSRKRLAYACGLCGKTFTSRYYLDQHLQRNHLTATGQGCDADWCRHFLSMQACHDIALELEPFYGRGNAEDASATKVRHALVREAHSRPCKEAEMLKVKKRCEQIAASCFSSESMAQKVNLSLCQPLTCHHRLHRLVTLLPGIDANRKGSFMGHDWSYVWAETHSRHYELGFFSAVVFIFLAFVYVRCGVEHFGRRIRLATETFRPRRTSRLLAPNAYRRSTRKDKLH